MQKITPFLWFDNNAQEAVEFYCSTFKNSKIKELAYYGRAAAEAAGRPENSVMTITFDIDGEEFVAINGGPQFTFSPAVSFVVNCETQEEIDYYWEMLPSGGGRTLQCGWLSDKFGVSWQIVPTILPKMLHDKDKVRSERVAKSMLMMNKIDIKELKNAYESI